MAKYTVVNLDKLQIIIGTGDENALFIQIKHSVDARDIYLVNKTFKIKLSFIINLLLLLAAFNSLVHTAFHYWFFHNIEFPKRILTVSMRTWFTDEGLYTISPCESE